MHENHQERQGLLRPVPRRDQAAQVHQRERRRRRELRSEALRLLLPQGAPDHCHRALAGQPLRVLEVQPRVRRRAVLHARSAAEDLHAGAEGPRLRALAPADPLRPEAGKHPDQVLQQVRGEGDRLRVLLLRGRPPVLLRAVAVVPRAGGYARPAVRPEDRPLVSGVHPRGALDRVRPLPERLCAESPRAHSRHPWRLPIPPHDAWEVRAAVLHAGRAALPGDRGALLPRAGAAATPPGAQEDLAPAADADRLRRVPGLPHAAAASRPGAAANGCRGHGAPIPRELQVRGRPVIGWRQTCTDAKRTRLAASLP
mmetsp:Transcript_8920/g.23923  ORF Transcript_8920/g.23923 Transcript_8920/m.23923 type:complete len:313 (+) Transcript_8920:1207-2145(+)